MANPFCYVEFHSRDRDRFVAFYGQLFNWTISESIPGYAEIRTGTNPGGGLTTAAEDMQPGILVYVLVDDILAHVTRAQALGGRQIQPMTEIPGTGHLAVIEDPDGNKLGLFTPLRSPDAQAGQDGAPLEYGLHTDHLGAPVTAGAAAGGGAGPGAGMVPGAVTAPPADSAAETGAGAQRAGRRVAGRKGGGGKAGGRGGGTGSKRASGATARAGAAKGKGTSRRGAKARR
ncbi:MAG TPA: VOC family protein [Myxococcota bacterium]|jgi:hypothetical protein|nr:VOC family protein [Myxococcota bacterium]